MKKMKINWMNESHQNQIKNGMHKWMNKRATQNEWYKLNWNEWWTQNEWMKAAGHAEHEYSREIFYCCKCLRMWKINYVGNDSRQWQLTNVWMYRVNWFTQAVKCTSRYNMYINRLKLCWQSHTNIFWISIPIGDNSIGTQHPPIILKDSCGTLTAA